ncbi:MAG: integrase core domain-containing protein [Deinococcales bacterium]
MFRVKTAVHPHVCGLDLAELKQHILAYQLWYNQQRLHSALNYLTPQQVFQTLTPQFPA